jgi:CHAT domain-containing protein
MLYEILQAPLRATLVSLGACQTAQVEGPATFPESLAHAFLGGGAQFVIASLWNAFDDECEKFAQRFYGALKQGTAPAAAFREAQLAQLESLGGYHDGYAFSDAELTRAANFVLLSARQPERNIA